MKFIERFFGKKEEAPLQTTLEFRELPQWIEAQAEQMFGPLSSHISRKYAQINAALEDISSSKDQLINAKFGEKVYKRMAKAGASNRDNLVKNLNIIIERIVVPEDTTPSSASEFYANTKSTLNNCLENAIKSQQYVKALFPEEYKLVLADLKQLDALLDELMLPIHNQGKKLEAFGRLPEGMELIQQTQQQIQVKRDHILDMEQKLELLNNELDAQEARLEEFRNSEAFIKAQELEEKARTLKDRVNGVDSSVKEVFAPLSKALSRVEKQDASGRHTLSSKHRKVLRTLMDDPVSALDFDITSFIKEIRSRVEDGSLGLKQQKMNKTLEQMDRLTDSDILSQLKEQRESHLVELSQVMETLEKLATYKEKTRLEDGISECNRLIKSTESGLELERKELERLTEDIEDLKTELNSHLAALFEEDIKIVY